MKLGNKIGVLITLAVLITFIIFIEIQCSIDSEDIEVKNSKKLGSLDSVVVKESQKFVYFDKNSYRVGLENIVGKDETYYFVVIRQPHITKTPYLCLTRNPNTKEDCVMIRKNL